LTHILDAILLQKIGKLSEAAYMSCPGFVMPATVIQVQHYNHCEHDGSAQPKIALLPTATLVVPGHITNSKDDKNEK
jgi:hypothetical protein